jgi:hypothetical protein
MRFLRIEESSQKLNLSRVYVVAGVRPEPLLGDHDAEDLGIISFHPEGRLLQGCDSDVDNNFKDVRNVSISVKLRKAGKEVITKRPPLREIKARGKEEAMRIVDRCKGPVFTDKVGKTKMEVVKLKYEAGFKAV